MRTLLFFTLLLTSAPTLLLAQDDQHAVFNNGIDQINCAAIGFIHINAGRPAIAQEMDCGRYESITSSIPADESSTTLRFSQTINSYKSKYANADVSDPVVAARGLDEAVGEVMTTIRSRPRSADVDALEGKLAGLKANILERIESGETIPTPAGDDEEELTTPDEDTGNSSGLFGTLALVFSLVALAISIYNAMRSRKAPQTLSPAENAMVSGNTPLPNSGIADLKERIKKIEEEQATILAKPASSLPADKSIGPLTDRVERLEHEYNKLSEELFEALAEHRKRTREALREITSPQGLPDKDNVGLQTMHDIEVSLEDEDLVEGEVPAPDPTTVANPPQPAPEPPVEGINEEPPQEMPTSAPGTNPPIDKSEQAPATEKNQYEGAAINHKVPDNANEVDNPDSYCYAPLPNSEGSFPDPEVTTIPHDTSIFEFEVYQDAPDKRIFTYLSYISVAEKVLDDPDTYLHPFAEVESSVSNPRTIMILDGGIVERKGEFWKIIKPILLRLE